MNFSDLSQLSDLSGISRIRSSSIRPSEKADSVSEFRASSSIQESTSKPSLTSGLHVDVSKIDKALASCESALHEYAVLELIQEILHEATECGTLQKDTAKKLRDIVAVHDAGKYLELPNTEKNIQNYATLLGITKLPKIQLSHEEKRDIGTVMENMLSEKLNDFVVSYETQGGSVKDALKNHDSFGKSCLVGNQGSELMRWKYQTDDICAEYYRDLLRCAELIYHWQQLKHVDMRELNQKSADYLLLQAQVAEVQARMAKQTCAVRMFKEIHCTVDAFRILSENLDAKIEETREEIRKKKALRTAYEDVSNAEYEQIMNKYTEILGVIRKKEHLMETL